MNNIDIKKIYYLNLLILLLFLILSTLIINFSVKNSEQVNYNAVIQENEIHLKSETKKLSENSVTTDSVVSNFVKAAVIESLSFEITKINEQLSVAKKFYTDNGWLSYNATINETLKNLIQEDMITMSTIVEKDPILMNTKNFAGISFWKFYTKATIRFVGKGGTTNQEYNVIIILSQKKDGKNIRGLAIDRFEIK